MACPPETALGADFAGDARHFAGKCVQLVHHRVDGVFDLENLAADVDGDLLTEVTVGNRGGDLRHVAQLHGEITAHGVDRVREVLPGTRHTWHLRLAAELSVGADFARDACDFGGERIELIDHRVDGVLQLENLALDVHGDLAGQVAAGDGGRHLGDVSHLRRQIGGEKIDVVGEVLPRAGHARDLRLTSKLAFGADLARHARDLTGKRVQLIDHRIDGLFQLQDLSADVDRDLLRQVSAGDRGGDVRDVADLGGEVIGHRVDAVGQVLPGTGDAEHLCLSAESSLGADLTRNAGHLSGERVQLVDHRIDGFFQQQNFAADVDRDFLREVAARNRRRHFRDVAHLAGEVARHEVDVVGEVFPGPGNTWNLGLAAQACRRCRPRAPRASLPTRTH